jgi:Heparinase II/III-like protein
MRKMNLYAPMLVIFILFLFSPLVASDPAIIPEHPRLFFRSQPWGPRGLTLEMVRDRARRQSAEVVLEKLVNSIPNKALRYLILDDDTSAVKVIAELQEPMKMDNITTDDGIILAWRAMAFDWLYHHPGFSAEKKKKAAEYIVQGANRLKLQLRRGGHIFHTRMYGYGMGIALAGLALFGDHPEAGSLARFGETYFKDQLFAARKLQDGTVHNGFGYGRKYTMWNCAHFISCWYSATGENLWEVIAGQQEDWARKEIHFLIAGRYPDKTYVRFADSYSITSDYYTFRAVSERTWAYADPVGSGILNLLIEENDGDVVQWPTTYIYFLFYDPDAPSVSHKSLPLKTLFSREGTGVVIWKTNWEDDGTTVFFKCGNYFGDHGHFDQGHLDVFRRSPLLLDSGSYLTFSGAFRTEYWHRTVAHNTVLVVDPAITDDEGGQRVFHSQSDGTIGEYLANKQAETGDILDYIDEDGFSYVAGDYSAAYTEDRVRRVSREVAFLAERYLVVLDRIETARAGLVPKVLWHCPVRPRVDRENSSFEVSRHGARAIVRTLLPADVRLEWIDGFRVGNKNIEPVGTQKGIEDMGVGRIEVSCGSPAGDRYLFLHLIDVADTEDTPSPAAAKFSGGGLRVAIGGQTVTFRADAVGLVR